MSRVLVIDDSPLVRDLLRHPLEAAGFDVAVAEDGQAAVERIDLFAPDVVVCDMQMPRMNGLQVLRELRARAPVVPVLILTEHADAPLIVSAMREGAYGYVIKAQSHDTLVREVRAALEHRKLLEGRFKIDIRNRAYQEDLDRLVQEKTAEIAQLWQLKAQAEKMGAIGTLLAGLAHEVNNPLAAVKSNVSWLQDAFAGLLEEVRGAIEAGDEGASMERLRRFHGSRAGTLSTLPQVFDEIQQGLTRVSQLIASLRRISYPVPARGSCEVAAALRQLEGAAGPQVRSRLRHTADPALVSLALPQEELVTVLQQLLLNAAQAIDAQSDGRIELELRRDDRGGAIIDVRDNGCGIPKENLGKIFEPFFTTQAPGKGMGLGLSVVFQVVQGAGGQVLVDSQVGRGTTVTVRLPPPG